MVGKWICAALLAATCGFAGAQAGDAADVGWSHYGGSQGFNRYSPLAQINASNVGKLKILWTRPALDSSLKAQFPDLIAGAYFRATPIEVDGVLYAPDGVGLVEAFDAKTGQTLWVQKPFVPTLAGASGASTRGVAYWKNGAHARIFGVHGGYLYALDAQTGAAIADFGADGRVDLAREGVTARFHVSGGPLVIGNVVVIGGGGGGQQGNDYGNQKKSAPETVRAYDAVSGRQLWEFSPMPAPGDPARATWGNGSADIAGAMGSYGQLSADEELGYVYVPFSAPNPPVWGGWRPGDNLYGDSLVALDARTGKKIWYFQTVHHDLWDWDLSAPPVLGDVVVRGRRIKAVMQTGKNCFLYALDRTNGKPIWPIVERPVPQSKVPGEHSARTQPFPTKPPAICRQGFTEKDVVDFTPAIHEEALKILRQYSYGPMYTPPTLVDLAPGGNKGTLTLPGTDGGCNWNCGAFDPKTGMYYTIGVNVLSAYGLIKPTDPKATVELQGYPGKGQDVFSVPGPRGLPLLKPPYSELVAVDMNRGSIRWKVPNGDIPHDDPELENVKLPKLGSPGRAALLVTSALIFAGESSNAVNIAAVSHGYGNYFHAFDKKDGRVLATITLPEGYGTTAAPITYSVDGKQYVIVAIGGVGKDPKFVAMGL